MCEYIIGCMHFFVVCIKRLCPLICCCIFLLSSDLITANKLIYRQQQQHVMWQLTQGSSTCPASTLLTATKPQLPNWDPT